MKLLNTLKKFVVENGPTLNQLRKEFPNEDVDTAVEFMVKTGVLSTEERGHGAVKSTIYTAPEVQSTVYKVEKNEEGSWALVSQTLKTPEANALVLQAGWSRTPHAAQKKAVAAVYGEYKSAKTSIEGMFLAKED